MSIIGIPKDFLQKILLKNNIHHFSMLNMQELLQTSPFYLDNHIKHYETWLQNNMHGTMDFLAKNQAVRNNPALLFPGVKTALILAIPYRDNSVYPDNPKLLINNIAAFALQKNYHSVLKKLCQKILAELNLFNPQVNPSVSSTKILIDSTPFFEKEHAKLAKLGFIGNNSLLISPQIGSFFFLATILFTTHFDLLANSPLKEPKNYPSLCEKCNACVNACPTGAITGRGEINATKCIAYLSIEQKDEVNSALIPNFKKTIFGCDICQNVCPYNKHVHNLTILPEFKITNPIFTTIEIPDLLKLTEKDFLDIFAGTSLMRAKYSGIIRNAKYWLQANSSPT